jgi:inner membrane protein YidH
VAALDSTKLAAERTRLAYERTLMAWVRTATSLISFGFTIFKFFEYLHEDRAAQPARQFLGPRHFGMLMIGIGLVALLLATFQHVKSMRALRADYQSAPYSLASVMAALIGVLGVLGFLSVAIK